MKNVHKKRMAIIAGYFKGETCGLLGPQAAATVIQDNTDYECIVIAVSRDDNREILKKATADYFGPHKPVIGFSTLHGREDLFRLAGELKDAGAVTFLAGPQADVDFLGEKEWQDYSHRFRGVSHCFSFCVHGPAEQIIPVLKNLDEKNIQSGRGVIFRDTYCRMHRNPEDSWNEKYLMRVRWDTIYRIDERGLVPHTVKTGQVLQQIGCPYANRKSWVEIDYPASFSERFTHKVQIPVNGCSFCDIAADKGFFGSLSMDAVISQIQSLPETSEGRKIPCELINENPLPALPLLLSEVEARGIKLSQVNLILRADWLLRGAEDLKKALHIAGKNGFKIAASSVGFESLNDDILRNLNKGVCVEDNLEAIALMRQLKEEYSQEWLYSNSEGSLHGFIHPTPWDTEEGSAEMRGLMGRYFLPHDILPPRSTPLIIHHASWLGDWIREIERRESICFRRNCSVIEWWE